MTMFDQLIAHAAELVLVIGPERRVQHAWGSDPVTGRSADQFVNHPLAEAWPAAWSSLSQQLTGAESAPFTMDLNHGGLQALCRIRVVGLDAAGDGLHALFVDVAADGDEPGGSQDIVREILRRHPDYMLVVDEAGEARGVSAAVVRDFGTGVGGHIGLPELMAGDAWNAFQARALPALHRDSEWRGSSTWIGTDGEPVPVHMHAVRLPAEVPSAPTRIAIFARDNGTERRIEEALRESERTLRAILDGTPVALISLEMNGAILSANQRAASLLGRGVSELVGMNLHRVMDDHAFEETVFRLEFAYSEDSLERWSSQLLTADGERLDVAITVRSVLGRGGQRVLLAALEDVTEHNRLQAEITHQLDHDVLTDLLNRRGLERVLKQRVPADDAPGFVFHLNIDYFRYINELIGQSRADAVLWEIADALRSTVAGTDSVLARVGADEFVVVRFDVDAASARQQAAGLLAGLETVEPAEDETELSVTGCVGYSALTEGGWLNALTSAGSACYAAKSAARGSIREYTADEESDTDDARAVMTAARSVRRALSDESVLLYAQPIYRTEGAISEAPHGFEILARFRDQDRVRFPRNLLSAAERFGLMDSFDRYMVTRALQWMDEHRGVMSCTDHVAINLSGNSVSDHNFQDFLVGAVKDSGIPPEKLCFEVTETIAVRNIAQARRLMHRVGALGCRFSLDDFGAGMCSFQYLRDLPADYVKIDGGFVQGMEDDPVRRQLVRSINETAQVLGKETVAEFVDSMVVLDMLDALGVNMVQGWLFSPAVPIDEIQTMVRRLA